MSTVNPYTFIVSLSTLASSISVAIKGKSILSPTNLFLSGSSPLMFSQLTRIDPFCNDERMRSSYPSFSGVVVPNFLVLEDKYLIFTFPETPKVSGFVDVIVQNEAGYGSLVIDSRLPFVSAYEGAEDIQFPWVNGLIFTVID